MVHCQDNDSTDGLGAPSDTSRPMGEVPQHEASGRGGGDMALGYVSNEKRAPGVSLVSQHFSFKTQLPAFWEGWGFSNWKLNKNHLEKETTNRLKPKKC